MLSDGVVEVPKVESEMPRRRGPAVIALLLLGGCIAALLSVSDHPAHSAVATNPVKGTAAPARPGQPASNWSYSSTTAEMAGAKQDVLCTTSPEGARLCFRQTGSKFESYLVFPEDDQQFLCTKFHCTTQIKVDDQPAFSTVGSESPDGNIAILYLGAPERLFALLQSAKQVEMGPPMYEQDGLVLHFHVSGLTGFGQGAAGQAATLGSGTPQVHDPRLTAPISPVDPDGTTPRTNSSPVNLRFGVA